MVRVSLTDTVLLDRIVVLESILFDDFTRRQLILQDFIYVKRSIDYFNSQLENVHNEKQYQKNRTYFGKSALTNRFIVMKTK